MSQLSLPFPEPRVEYRTVSYCSTVIDERHGEPFRWTNVLPAEHAERMAAEARRRWPTYRIEVTYGKALTASCQSLRDCLKPGPRHPATLVLPLKPPGRRS